MAFSWCTVLLLNQALSACTHRQEKTLIDPAGITRGLTLVTWAFLSSLPLIVWQFNLCFEFIADWIACFPIQLCWLSHFLTCWEWYVQKFYITATKGAGVGDHLSHSGPLLMSSYDFLSILPSSVSVAWVAEPCEKWKEDFVSQRRERVGSGSALGRENFSIALIIFPLRACLCLHIFPLRLCLRRVNSWECC